MNQELVLQILSSSTFDPVDRPTVKEVIGELMLHGVNTTVDVNKAWKAQVEIEAKTIYLIGKYDNKLQEAEIDLAELEAEIVLGLPEQDEMGRKLTVEYRKTQQKWGVAADPSIQTCRRRRDAARSLVRDLTNLSRVVFARNQKLEHLSVNYRREMRADEDAG